MLKYKNIYRVCYEFDSKGNPSEFTFIPCRIKREANIYRYSDKKLLVYIPSIQISKKLLEKHNDIFTLYIEGDRECILIFDEKNIKNVENILKIYKKGKNIAPKSKNNLKFQVHKDVLNS